MRSLRWKACRLSATSGGMSPRSRVRIRPGPASGGVTEGCTLLGLPGAEEASDQHELPQVIPVVIGEDERFAQRRLSGAVRDAREEVGSRVAHESLHRPEIALHLGDALVPRGGIEWRVTHGPVARRPLR